MIHQELRCLHNGGVRPVLCAGPSKNFAKFLEISGGSANVSAMKRNFHRCAGKFSPRSIARVAPEYFLKGPLNAIRIPDLPDPTLRDPHLEPEDMPDPARMMVPIAEIRIPA